MATGFCAEVVKEIQRRVADRSPLQVAPGVGADEAGRQFRAPAKAMAAAFAPVSIREYS
ncbi:hypothetical protein [Duganella sp. BuS-21]|uniref:hypothetical protein n=1 Tax=Duganella sp. BuS-21 TaxID=2943848 RepID=UPI0035A6BC4B